LRAILEQAMLEVMYELPTRANIKKCIVNKNTILKGERPVMVLADGVETPPKGNATEKAESA
jgi:ATP-dependent Clp protease ATP-binding subunit ClpX